MKCKFVYTKEYFRPLRATLVDIRYSGAYPTVTDSDLFYVIEDSETCSPAGVLILTVDNALQSCAEKFHAVRTPFIGYTDRIKNCIKDFVNSDRWKLNYLFYTPSIRSFIASSVANTPLSNISYGFNGNMSASPISFSNANLQAAINGIAPQNMRYPGGTVANDWNWQEGISDSDPDEVPNTLDDIQALYNACGCDIVFVLNMVTRGLPDQLNMLAAAAGRRIPIRYVELGNEFDNLNNPGHIVYPTSTAYATAALVWKNAIKAIYPDVLVACVGEDRHIIDEDNWNGNVVDIASPDALVWHEYPDVDEFAENGIANLDRLDAAILAHYIKFGFNRINYPIWVTEYNWNYLANGLSYDSQIATTLRMTQTISQLIESNSPTGKKVMCCHNIVGKEGAFDISQHSIVMKPTGIAIKQFLES